jgi:uncharacterized membrane protein YesL
MTEQALNNPETNTQDGDDLRSHIEAYSSFVMANMLWAACSLPLVTIPAATAGMMAVMSARVRGKHGNVFEVFFDGVRTRWRPATVIGLIDFALGLLVAGNMHILGQMAPDNVMTLVSGAATLFAVVIALMANVYALGLLGLDSFRYGRILRLSFAFAFGYPAWTLAVVIAAGAAVGVSLLLPRGIFALVTVSAVAYIVAWGSWRVLKRHLNEEEQQEYL